MAQKIKFRTGTLEAYQGITPDNNTLYFIEDTLQLYKGSELYAKSYRIVDSVPTVGMEGVLYIDRVNKAIKAFENGVWVDGLNLKPVIADEVTVSGTDAVSGKAVAAYVQTAIENVTGGENATVITGIVTGSDFGTLVVTQGTEETPVSVNLDGVVLNPTYKADTRTITLPVLGADKEDIVINLGKDMVVKSGSYDAATGDLVLVLTDDSEVKIPVGDLVDTYNPSSDKSGAVQIEISNHEIKGTVLVDNSTVKINTDGKLIADFSTLVTKTAFEALEKRVAANEADITTLKTNVSNNAKDIENIKTDYLTKTDASNTYVTKADFTQDKSALQASIDGVNDAWQAAMSWGAISAQ